MNAVSLATRGVICTGSGTGGGDTIIQNFGGGGGGGAGLERPKPVVRVSGVNYDKYKKENINIIIKDMNYE